MELSPPRSTYRADIDGLRTIAVMAVILYHLGVKLFGGGFVGVDIFFVISGFLITSTILNDLEQKSFSIFKFYERRIRRIFPALFFMLTGTLTAGWLFYNAEALSDTAKAALSTIFFYSNHYFYSTTGYFEKSAELQPLLHMWSLAVEEQFYLLFPLLMFLVHRFGKQKYNILVITGILFSFLLNLWLTDNDLSGAFYFAPNRAWELLLGSILAATFIKPIQNNTLSNAGSIVGIVLILFSIFTFSNDTIFPGSAAILPTLGTVLIIFFGANEGNLVSRALSWNPNVFVGKISYSLYLWHWPIIVFYRYAIFHDLTTLDQVAIVAGAFVISVISWKFVENPFRNRVLIPRKVIFSTALVVVVIFGLGTYWTVRSAGFPSRFEDGVYLNIARSTDNPFDDNRFPSSFKPSKAVMIGAPVDVQTFVLWGDSHAEAIAPGLEKAAQDSKTSGFYFSKPNCAPLTEVSINTKADKKKDGCLYYNRTVLDFILNQPSVDTVFISARWAWYANGHYINNPDSGKVTLVDVLEPNNIESGNKRLLEVGLSRTIDALDQAGIKVILVTTIPEVNYDVPSKYFIAYRTGQDINQLIGPTLTSYNERNASFLNMLERLKTERNLAVIDPWDVLCKQKNRCDVVVDTKPIYRDDDHLSIFGARQFTSAFSNYLQK